MPGVGESKGKIQQGVQYFKDTATSCKEADEKLEGATDALHLAHTGILGVLENLKRAGVSFGEAVGPLQVMAAQAKEGDKLFKEAAGGNVQDPHIYRNLQVVDATASGLKDISIEAQRASTTGLQPGISALGSLASELEATVRFWNSRRQITQDAYPNQALPTIVDFAEQWRDSL